MWIVNDRKRYILTEATIGAIGAVGAAGVNALSQGLTNVYNRRQYEDAWKKQQAAIMQQNAYNSPSAEVGRMRAAGINPSVAYGSGEMLGQQAEIPSASPIPAESPLGSGSALSAIDSMLAIREQKNRNQLAQADLIVKASTSGVNFSQVRLNSATAKEVLELLGYKKENMSASSELMKMQWSEIHNRINEINSRIDLNTQELKNRIKEWDKLDVETKRILALYPSEKAMIDASASERRAMAKKVAEEYSLLQEYYKLQERGVTSQEEFNRIQEEENKRRNKREYILGGANTVVQAAGVASQYIFKGASIGSVFGQNAYEMSSRGSSHAPSYGPLTDPFGDFSFND